MNAQADFIFRTLLDHRLLTSRAGLADLLAQRFVGVTDSLVLVRIRRTQGAHVRRHLAEQSAGLAASGPGGCLLVDLHVDAIGQKELDRMRIAQSEGRDPALDVGAVSDADDVQFAVNPRRDTLNGVGGERAGQSVQRGVLSLSRRTSSMPSVCWILNARRNRDRLLTLGPFYLQLTRRP